MKTPRLFPLAALSFAAFAGSAFAAPGHLSHGEAGLQPDAVPFVSQTSRASVQASARQALQAHRIALGEQGAHAIDAPLSGTLSRADVRAQARDALAAGEIGYGEAVRQPRIAGRTPMAQLAHAEPTPLHVQNGELGGSQPASWNGQAVRSQVRADARQAARAGELEHGESASVGTAFHGNAQLTRPAVRAEARQALKAGEIAHGEL